MGLGLKVNALLSLTPGTYAKISESCHISKSSLGRFLTGQSDIRSASLVKILRQIGIDIDMVVNRKVREELGEERKTPHIGSDLETILENIDPISTKTMISTLIARAKKQRKVDLKKEIKNLEQFSKSLKSGMGN